MLSSGFADETNAINLHNMRRNNLNHIFFWSLKYQFFAELIWLFVKEFTGNDVLLISEKKLDDTFPEYQFRIPGFATLFPKVPN